MTPAVSRPRAALARLASVAPVFACLALLAAPARAIDWGIDETKPALRASIGVDVYRVPGTVVASARYGGSWNVKASTWLYDAGVSPDAPRLLLGGGYMITVSRFRFGAGLAWIDKTNNNVNGTHWNFDGSVAYDVTDRVFVEYQHYSHGAILGLKNNTSNGGWNLIGVGYVF